MDNRKTVVYFLAISLALLTTTAHADEKRGWSLSVGIGPSRIKDRDGSDSFDANGFGYSWRRDESGALLTAGFNFRF